MRSIIEPGDEILIPGPIYAGYIPLVETLGGKPIYIDTTNTEFKITPELIAQHYTDKTKAIFLNYPTNPTGVILERDEVKGIVNYLKEKEILLLAMKFMQKILSKVVMSHLQNLRKFVINYYLLVG